LLPKTRLGLHGSFARLLTQRDLEDILRSVRRSAAEAADDPYALLGVPRNASPEAIKAAYRAQVKRIHPDLQAAHADAAHLTRLNQRLARLNAAYQAVRPKP
jgi:DnaJ like chaperone protein